MILIIILKNFGGSQKGFKFNWKILVGIVVDLTILDVIYGSYSITIIWKSLFNYYSILHFYYTSSQFQKPRLPPILKGLKDSTLIGMHTYQGWQMDPKEG